MSDGSAPEHARLGTRLGASIAAAAPDAFAILVVSPRAGDGRSTLCEVAARANTLERPLRVVRLKELHGMSPDEMDADEVLLIDGPAANEGLGLAEVPREWIVACDASVVVAARRSSRVGELEELSETLAALGVPCVGVIMNEDTCPAPGDGLRRALSRVRGLFGRRARAGEEATS